MESNCHPEVRVKCESTLLFNFVSTVLSCTWTIWRGTLIRRNGAIKWARQQICTGLLSNGKRLGPAISSQIKLINGKFIIIFILFLTLKYRFKLTWLAALGRIFTNIDTDQLERFQVQVNPLFVVEDQCFRIIRETEGSFLFSFNIHD